MTTSILAPPLSHYEAMNDVIQYQFSHFEQGNIFILQDSFDN